MVKCNIQMPILMLQFDKHMDKFLVKTHGYQMEFSMWTVYKFLILNPHQLLLVKHYIVR